MKFAFFFGLLFAFSLWNAATTAASVDPCPPSKTSREWSATCFENGRNGRQIKEPYRKNVSYDRRGYAVLVILAPAELVSVDRRARVIAVKRRHLTDFDFEPQEGTLARFGYLKKNSRNETVFKCGYYRVGKFQVAVPPIYDQCDSFVNGQALVCYECISHCDSGDCHEAEFINGEGLIINEKNEILKKINLPSLPACRHTERAGADTTNCSKGADQAAVIQGGMNGRTFWMAPLLAHFSSARAFNSFSSESIYGR